MRPSRRFGLTVQTLAARSSRASRSTAGAALFVRAASPLSPSSWPSALARVGRISRLGEIGSSASHSHSVVHSHALTPHASTPHWARPASLSGGRRYLRSSWYSGSLRVTLPAFFVAGRTPDAPSGRSARHLRNGRWTLTECVDSSGRAASLAAAATQIASPHNARQRTMHAYAWTT